MLQVSFSLMHNTFIACDRTSLKHHWSDDLCQPATQNNSIEQGSSAKSSNEFFVVRHTKFVGQSVFV